MLTFRFKKQLYLFQIVLFCFLGLFLITDNINQVMAINSENIFNKTDMQIHDIFIEKVEDISYYVINKDYFNCFSSLTLEYPCYNGTNNRCDLSWKIKTPYFMFKTQPVQLLCIVFDKGIRDKLDDKYTLEDLKKMGNGSLNMYIFWLLNSNSKIDEQKKIKDINKEIFYQLEIKYKEKEMAKIKNQLNLLKNQKTELKNKIKDEINYYKNILEAKELEILSIKTQKDNLENQLKSKQQDLEKLQQEINQKEEQLHSKEQQLIEQKNLSDEEINNLNLEINTLKTDINQKKINFEDQLSLKEEEITQLKNQLNLLKVGLQNQKNQYQKIIINLNKKINTYSGIFGSLYKKFFEF